MYKFITKFQSLDGVYYFDYLNAMSFPGQASRKGFKPLEQSRGSSNYDHDDNKYKQKSTFAWLSRWWK